MSLRWIPNAITITRMVMAFPLLWLLTNRHFVPALALALLAGLSDALIVSGAFAWWLVIGTLKPAPSQLSKTNTAAQLLLVAVALVNAIRVDAGMAPVPLVLLQALVLATAVMTVVSGLDYFWRYGSRAIRAHRSK